MLDVSATIRAIAKPITPLNPPHHKTIESFTVTPYPIFFINGNKTKIIKPLII